MKGFDVLYDPWIPVIRQNGKRDCLGIISTLEQAHELKEVLCDDLLETYAVQRLLIAFVMDAYWSTGQLRTVSDRRSLYQRGYFDCDVLKAYVDLCKTEGSCFDLFDKERPFMQSAFCKELDENKRTGVSKLFIHLPRDNTPIHFEHSKPGKLAVSPSKCLPALLATYCFSVAMVQGYPSSVNGSPCYYFLIHEDNLFKTLVLSSVSQYEQGQQNNNMPVAWRDRDIVVPKEAFAEMSVLSAFTGQPRRISLIRDDDGLIREVYYQQGRNYMPIGQWRDPHTALRVSSKGELFLLKPSLGRALWRDIGCFGATSGNTGISPRIVENYSKIRGMGIPCPVEAFGIVTNKASLIALAYDRLQIPDCICEEQEKAKRLTLDLIFIEDLASMLSNFLLRMEYQISERDKMNSKIKRSELTDEAQTKFFSKMQIYITGEYFAMLEAADTSVEWEDPIINSVNETVKKCVLETLNDAKRGLGTSARQLQAQAGNERTLLVILNKKMKERVAYE